MSRPLSNGEVRHPSVNVDALREIKSDPGKYFEGRRRLTFGFSADSDKKSAKKD